MSKQLITIIMATYNRAHFIVGTLQSIQNQTYKNFECLIIDDGSTDNTSTVVKDFFKKDNRFLYYRRHDSYPKGLSGSRNYGLALARIRKAQFIQFFDDDDIMHPQKIELHLKEFDSDPDLQMSTCLYRKFHDFVTIEFDLNKANDLSCKIESSNLFKDFLFSKINLNSLGPIWKASVLFTYAFDESLSTGEERDLYLRIFFKEKIKYKAIDKVLFWYRKHSDSITSRPNQDNSLVKIDRKIAWMIIRNGCIDLSILNFAIKTILTR